MKQFLKELLKAGTRPNISRPGSSLASSPARRQSTSPQGDRDPLGGSPSGHLLRDLQPSKRCQPWRIGSCSSWKAGPPAKWMGRELAGNQQASGKKFDKLGFHKISLLKRKNATFSSQQNTKQFTLGSAFCTSSFSPSKNTCWVKFDSLWWNSDETKH